MDLYVLYWDDTVRQVRTSYWTSEFLGKASADDVLSKYDACVSQLDEQDKSFFLNRRKSYRLEY